MSIILKRIYLENYKLFKSKTMTFARALSVFDGPNGYGKTSTFDAIELLITGQISRMLENDAAQGTVGYEENFLAGDQSRNVVIKGEFYDSETRETLIMVRCIPHGMNNRDNNPKKIFKKVKTFFLSDFDQPEEKWKKVSQNAARERCARFFGEQNVNLYALLHYVRQEDRLAFFKQSEKERIQVIEKLFGLEEYRRKLDKAQSALLRLNKEKGRLKKLVDATRADVESRPGEPSEQVAYEALVSAKPKWDREKLGFRGADTGSLHQQYLEQVEGVQALVLHREEFRISRDTKAFREIPEEKRGMALLAWKLHSGQENAVQLLRDRKNLRDFLVKQRKAIQKKRFDTVQWKRLCGELDAVEEIHGFTYLADQIKKARTNQSDLQKSLTELDAAREQLRTQLRGMDMPETGTCPYCGQNWGDAPGLDARFEQAKAGLLAVLDREGVHFMTLVEECGDKFEQHLAEKLARMLEELDQDSALRVFDLFPDWQTFENYANACRALMNRLGVEPEQVKLEEDTVQAAAPVLERAEALCSGLSPEYVALDQKYDFGRVYQENVGNMDALDRLSAEALDRKKQYIRNQFYHSFDESIERLAALESRHNTLKELCRQLEQYTSTLREAVNVYRKQVISQIEIPFFLYSSRLLQSYPGGQGVLITSKDGDKVRFTAPGKEHDVLYTMSSGQLSAVLLSFALSLNKIYSGSGFRTLLIDDPIQCMDDINMVSLVELLGREFGQSQVILSTHEDVFARYIRYKYEKYGLQSRPVSLKDSNRSAARESQ